MGTGCISQVEKGAVAEGEFRTLWRQHFCSITPGAAGLWAAGLSEMVVIMGAGAQHLRQPAWT